MSLNCLRSAFPDRGREEIKQMLHLSSQRVSKSTSSGRFDCHSAVAFSSPLSPSLEELELKNVVSDIVTALAGQARSWYIQSRGGDLIRSIQTFDGLVSVLLSSSGVRSLEAKIYMRFASDFGERVLHRVLSADSLRSRVRRLNCESVLNECFKGWKESLEPGVCEHLMDLSQGWQSMEKQLRRHTDETHQIPHNDPDIGLYDLAPVALRTPVFVIHSQKSFGQKDFVADASIRREMSRLHVSFFRYLISKREFARHVVALVHAHNIHVSGNLNDSNMTVLNNTPPKRRRGSIDSLLSYLSGAAFGEEDSSNPSVPVNLALDLFSSHCINFFASFGTGLLLPIANDLVSAMAEPPTDFLRLMIGTRPENASSEGHAAVRRYLSAQLLSSLRNLIHSRNHNSVAEDGCLSFLMRAEMNVSGPKRWTDDYRVVSAMVSAALEFTRNDREIMRESVEKKFMGSLRFKQQLKIETALIAWLSHFADMSADDTSSLMRSLLNSNEGKKEIRALYREMASADVSANSQWEADLSAKISVCRRMMRSDFRLLITTANGLGITPVPVAESVLQDQFSLFHRSQSIMSDRTQISIGSRHSKSFNATRSQPASPVTPRIEVAAAAPPTEEQTTIQMILEELVSMRNELNTNTQNFESLKGEVGMIKNSKKSPQSPQCMRDDPMVSSPAKLEDQRIPMSSPARPPASPQSKVENMFKSFSAAG